MNLDKKFISFYQVMKEFEAKGTIPFALSMYFQNTPIYVFKSNFKDDLDESYRFFKKLIYGFIWMYGCDEIRVTCDKSLAINLIKKFSLDPESEKTLEAIRDIYGRDFDLTYSESYPYEVFGKRETLSSSFSGARIGFDAGGSDRKVSVVLDGKVLYEKETLWLPKENSDWKYHYEGIKQSLVEASKYLDKVEAVGISTAGVVTDNLMVQAALFCKVPKADLKEHVETIYTDIVKELFPNARCKVLNDGDISAIAGAMWLKKEKVLGLAFGTSEASGYCYSGSEINGYFNELGKVPLDFSPEAAVHKTMNISGAGSMYLSQNGVIRLAEENGFKLEGTLASKLKQVQKEVELGNPVAKQVFEDMGIYLANALGIYAMFYEIENVIILGRVTSGLGGEILLESCKNYIKEFIPEIKNIEIILPDETFRRLGQSFVASSIA